LPSNGSTGSISHSGLLIKIYRQLIPYYSCFISEGVAEASQILYSVPPTCYKNYLAISNTADVTGSEPIAVWSQSISGVNAFNPLVAFYDIHGRKREVLFFYFVPDTTRASSSSSSSSSVKPLHIPRHFFFPKGVDGIDSQTLLQNVFRLLKSRGIHKILYLPEGLNSN
jgi:hypothetical protein